MRSGGNVLLTAMSAISSGWRPARCAAASILARTRSMFSAIDMRKDTTTVDAEDRCEAQTPEIPRCARDDGARLTLRTRRHMIAVGGAGSSGLPALASGTLTMTKARITSTINPEIVAGWSKITG